MSLPPSQIEHRRSGRIAAERPIEVSGTNIEGRDFLAYSRTLILSRYGAKIYLDQGLGLDQEIIIYRPETMHHCLAKVVGLYDRYSDGYTYGIEFLDPDLDFWSVAFLSSAEPGAVQTQPETSAERPRTRIIPQPLSKFPKFPTIESNETSQPTARPTAWPTAGKDYRSRRERPQGGEVPREQRHREQRHSEFRIRRAVEVWVSGVDLKGDPFLQTAYSLDISRSGARLNGVGFLTVPGRLIEVRRGREKAQFRVAWVGQRGTDSADQVGLYCIEPEKNIWGLH